MQSKYELMSFGFNENEALVLLEWLNGVIFSKDNYINNDLIFNLSQDGCSEVIITLKNAVFDTECITDDLVSFNGLKIISETENGYSLSGDADYYDCENNKSVSFKLCIVFDSIEIKCRAIKTTFYVSEYETPWYSLSCYASDIYEKTIRPYLTVNEKEKALVPLLKELYMLNNNCFNQDLTYIKLDALKNNLPKNKKLNRLIETVEESNNADKRYKAIEILFSYMSCEKFENCWRNILAMLDDSQADYEEENNSEIYNKLCDVHKYIDEVMRCNGYEGSYPAYKKSFKIKGMHLRRNKNDLYFVGMESCSVFIECKDNIYNDFGNIEFQISTAIGKTDKAIDKYSSLFSKKGKGYYNTEQIIYEINESGDVQFEPDEIKKIPHIVCKKADFKKLSKSEKKKLGLVKTKDEIISIMSICLIIGLAFGILMTLGFMLLEFIITLFDGSISEFNKLFLETPWWMIFLFSWLGFGSIMGALNLIVD